MGNFLANNTARWSIWRRDAREWRKAKLEINPFLAPSASVSRNARGAYYCSQHTCKFVMNKEKKPYLPTCFHTSQAVFTIVFLTSSSLLSFIRGAFQEQINKGSFSVMLRRKKKIARGWRRRRKHCVCCVWMRSCLLLLWVCEKCSDIL